MTQVNDEDAVQAAAAARGAALRRGDRFELESLLHPSYTWTSHRGDVLDRDGYVAAQCGGGMQWHDQQLGEVAVSVVGDAAVLTAVATDLVSQQGEMKRHRMRLTLTFVRDDASDTGGGWLCLAGHAGPQLESPKP